MTSRRCEVGGAVSSRLNVYLAFHTISRTRDMLVIEFRCIRTGLLTGMSHLQQDVRASEGFTGWRGRDTRGPSSIGQAEDTKEKLLHAARKEVQAKLYKG